VALLGIIAAAWAIAGGVGAYQYIHQYWLYRGFAAPRTPPGISAGATRVVRFWSEALHQERAYLVYTPPDYAEQAAGGHRFPVLYLLHAPPGRPDGYFLAGAIGVRADTLIAGHRIPPLIMVLPYGKSRRFANDTEWANAGAGRYMDFVLDVVHDADHRFATVRNRGDRVIAGLSEGGYGALNVALHHLGAFSGAQSWSGYFVQTPTQSFSGASPAVLRANSPLDELPALASVIRRLGFRAWVYQGLSDPAPPVDEIQFSRRLAAAGAAVHFGFFPGAHDWGLWRAQIPRMLVAAGRWFAAPAERTGPALVEVGESPPATARRRTSSSDRPNGRRPPAARNRASIRSGSSSTRFRR
jgi:enterochelin esterase-like enzyme